ncbi:hypothetical protein BPODLACK_01708 [Gordonia sp. YY1]|nr:hypothetical protein BPODLACK_01708 [Gordonia sp. YY1]
MARPTSRMFSVPDVEIEYSADDNVEAVIANGVETTYTYNEDGTIATDTRGDVTREYEYELPDR